MVLFLLVLWAGIAPSLFFFVPLSELFSSAFSITTVLGKIALGTCLISVGPVESSEMYSGADPLSISRRLC